MFNKVICIIQARMASTRLKGKVLMSLCNKSVLEHEINRLKKVFSWDQIIVATTNNDEDIKIVKEAKALGVNFFRGEEDDVLDRYYEAAKFYKGNIIVRVTSDCPCIDNFLIEKIVRKFINLNRYKKVDYLSNTLNRTFPRGYDVEIFSFESLEKSYELAQLKYEREHVTPFIYNNGEKFNIRNYENPVDYSKYRVTLDTKEDFQVIEAIYKELYEKNNNFTLNEVIDFLKRNPNIAKLNMCVQQKKLGE